MTAEDTADTTVTRPGMFEKTLAGRQIWFHNLTIGQLAIMRRRLDVFKRQLEDDKEKFGEPLADLYEALLKVVDSRFEKDEDRTFVADQMLEGKLQVTEILTVIGFNTVQPEDDADVPAPVKRPGRKAAAKKTASPSRVRK